jgi:CBS domain-containing protein
VAEPAALTNRTLTNRTLTNRTLTNRTLTNRDEKKESTMLAKDVMSRTVVTVRPHMPARAAAALLVANGFTSAPVVTAEGVVRGMVSEADLMRGQSLPDPDDLRPMPDHPASEVMTAEPVTKRPTDDLADVVAAMLDNGIRSVPIVENGRLVGIISRRDVLRCVARRELIARGAGLVAG